MGCIDTNTKEYVKRPRVFADLFNFLIYDGRPVIRPESLSELDTTQSFTPYDRNGKVFPVQKYRDVLKQTVIMTNEKAAYALVLGVENQTDTHYAMPVRNMGYDAYHYAAQVDAIARKNKKNKHAKSEVNFLSGLKKDDKIIPVITLVLHFGQEPWDGPTRLYEMFETQDPEILRFVPDYKINLISPISMSMSEIEKFTSDFKQLAAFLHCGKDREAMKNLMERDEAFRCMDPLTANIANDLTHSGLKLTTNQKGEVNMCVAIAGIREEGRLEGRQEGISIGRNEGISIGRNNILNEMISRGIITSEEAAQFS